MKAAIYARYSTDKQDADSLARQIRNCELRAKREGWTIVDRYEDPAISGGTRMRERPEGARLLADAEARKFDLVLVDDLSRAFRNQADQIENLEWLLFHGIHVVGASDGIDTRMENYNLSASMFGIMNAQYRKDLAKKVHGQLSLIATKGKNAGGLPYGYEVIYETVTDEKGRASSQPVGRKKHPEKAKWVRFIFEKYAAGWPPRKIADELNRRQVPSPGSYWKRKVRRCRGWLGSAIQVILENPLYAGKQVWNRSKWVDIPDEIKRKKGLKGKKLRIDRPENEWIVTEVPDLAVIPPKLWAAVQARRKANAALYNNQHPAMSPRQKFLFSGLLKCGECGASFVIISRTHYGCGSHVNGGKHVCSNRLRVPRKLVEEKLLAAIQHDLFAPEYLSHFIRRTTELLAARRQTTRPDLAAVQQALMRTEKEIGNIMAAIKAGILTPTTKAELEKAEAERGRLRALLDVDTRELAKVADLLPRAVDRYKAKIEELATVAQRDAARAKAQLRSLLGGPVPLRPTKQGYLEAELAGDYAGLVLLASAGKTSVNLRGSGGRI